MRYLLFAEFEANPLENDAMMSQYNDSHVFLDYSANHWATHVRESHTVDNVATQSMLRLCDTNSNRCLTWFRIYWASTISWAAGNGFDIVVKLLIKGIRRRLKGIKLPFRKKAQVDSVDRYGRTPLVYAVWNGHVAVIKRLLKAGARINVADDIGGTALSYAVCSGHNDVLTLLFEKGIEAGSEDETRIVLLVSAAEKGHEAVVKLLLEAGKIDLELKDGNGRTPLSCAVKRGSVAIVQLLLTEGAKTDYKYKIVSRFNHISTAQY